MIREPSLDVNVSGPVVGLLAHAGLKIPTRLRKDASAVIRAHLEEVVRAGTGTHWNRPTDLLPTLLAWAESAPSGDLEEDLPAALLLCAEELQVAEERFIIEWARRRPADIGPIIEDPTVTSVLAQARSDLLLRLSGCYYVDTELFVDPEMDQSIMRDTSPERRGYVTGWAEREGIRDHVPLRGLPMRAADRGPFLALLRADAIAGRRLIGAVVGAATNARSRLEARHRAEGSPWFGGEVAVKLVLPNGQSRTFRGTDHVWIWYRGAGVGPPAAMSALLALREWATEELENGTALDDIISAVLGCGESIAFVAVAVSLAVENFEEGRPLDRFFCHPLVWELELHRYGQEHSPVRVPLPDGSRLLNRIYEIVTMAVISSDENGRTAWRQVGQELIGHVGELDDTSDGADLRVQRWAALLDFDSYRLEDAGDGMIRVSPDLPEELEGGPEAEFARKAGLKIRLTSIGHAAADLRDRETLEAGAADEVIDIWRTAMEVIDDLGEDGSDSPLSPYDVAAAASAAALRCAASGFLAQVAELVDEASRLLLDVAIAMPALPDGTRGMIRPEGADRSAAVGLPLLLLAQIEGVTDVEIEQTLTALLRLAESPFVEVRSRLVQGLELLIIGGVDGDSCEARRHEEVLAVLRELIASSGRVAAGHGRGRRERLDDVQSALASDSVIGDIAGMADAIPGLVALSRESCTHAVEAASLLNALIGYDRRVWPVHFARYGYADEHVWRGAIDSVVVGRILDGDLDELWRYLDAFGPVAEHLAGLLQKLASGADAGAKAILLHDLWPIILDRLLPDNRNLIAYGDGNRRPHYQDVRALDRVLLLTPDGAVDWPWERTIALWRRWVTAYESHPHLADRLVDTLNRAGLLADPVATDWVLLVLGTDAAAIDRGSNKVVAWIRYVLVDHPEAVNDRRRPLDILDGLVRKGDATAIALQQEIES